MSGLRPGIHALLAMPAEKKRRGWPGTSAFTRVFDALCPAKTAAGSIERHGRPKLIVVHAREIVARVHVSCPSEEEFLEGFGGARTQRISDASECDPDGKALRACDRHQLEMVREYPRPIGNKVILRERHVRVAARHHLGKIAMHDADATGKVRRLGGEE